MSKRPYPLTVVAFNLDLLGPTLIVRGGRGPFLFLVPPTYGPELLGDKLRVVSAVMHHDFRTLAKSVVLRSDRGLRTFLQSIRLPSGGILRPVRSSQFQTSGPRPSDGAGAQKPTHGTRVTPSSGRTPGHSPDSSTARASVRRRSPRRKR